MQYNELWFSQLIRKKNEGIFAPCLLFCAVIFLTCFYKAYAAPLNYNADVGVSLSSPATNLTIKSGSVADVLAINATSAIATLSSSTGGSLTLTSPSYDLSVSSSSGGGTVSNTCSSGVVTVVISQSTGATNYTIAPSGTTCSGASAPIVSSVSTNVTTNSATVTWTTNIAADSTVSYGLTSSYGSTSTDPTLVTSHSITLSGLGSGTLYHFVITSAENGTSTTTSDNTFTTSAVSNGGGGGGGGGGSGYYVPVTTPASTSTPTSVSSTIFGSTTSFGSATSCNNDRACLLVLIAQLEAELQTLLKEVAARIHGATPFVFTKNLFFGMRDPDIASLQTFLDAHGFPVSTTGPGSLGSETNYFGNATQKALAAYQANAGIVPAAGYFGPKTRTKINVQ